VHPHRDLANPRPRVEPGGGREGAVAGGHGTPGESDSRSRTTRRNGAQGSQKRPGAHFTVCVDCRRSLEREAFLFQRGGERLSSMAVHRAWHRVLPAAQVRYRSPEQLRHTFASTMLSRNAPLLYLQQQGGWRSAAVLLRVDAGWMPQPSATPAQPVVLSATVSTGGDAR
jgi:hypothetical protein